MGKLYDALRTRPLPSPLRETIPFGADDRRGVLFGRIVAAFAVFFRGDDGRGVGVECGVYGGCVGFVWGVEEFGGDEWEGVEGTFEEWGLDFCGGGVGGWGGVWDGEVVGCT